MRALVEGEVIEVEPQDPYTGQDGVTRRSVRVFLRADNPRFAADSYEVDEADAPEVGEVVRQVCNFRAYNSRSGGFLSVRAVKA